MNSELSSRAEFRAVVEGKELTEFPDDLFIPPDALEVLLDSFSGPLDLLLYLIRKQHIDILNIPIVSITKQYLHYIQLMESRCLELAADYLLMAATLAEIKSRFLLPVFSSNQDNEEEDPKMILVRKLQAYEQIKQATQLLDALPRQERDNFPIQIISEMERIIIYPEVSLSELIGAMKSLLQRVEQVSHHQITREVLSVRERMSTILLRLKDSKILDLNQIFTLEEGKKGLIVSLLAILELARQTLIVLTQREAFSSIYLQAV